MPNVRDFLDRFRPAGTPGAASSVGVPADRRADAEVELAAVFAALENVERRCADLLGDAERAAAQRIGRTQRQASALIAQAASASTAERAAAAAQARSEVAAESARILAQGERLADEERTDIERRLPEVLDRVVGRARAQLQAVAGEAP